MGNSLTMRSLLLKIESGDPGSPISTLIGINLKVVEGVDAPINTEIKVSPYHKNVHTCFDALFFIFFILVVLGVQSLYIQVQPVQYARSLNTVP